LSSCCVTDTPRKKQNASTGSDLVRALKEKTKAFRSILRFLLFGSAWLVGGLAVAWTAGALYYDLPAPSFRTAAAVCWLLAAAALGFFAGWRGRLVLAIAFALIAGWWSTLRPRLDGDWQPEVAVLAYATRDGDRLTIHNIRNFEYRTATDFTPRYETL
jgi:hypothetical protein